MLTLKELSEIRFNFTHMDNVFEEFGGAWLVVERGTELQVLKKLYKINPDFNVNFFDGVLGTEAEPKKHYVATVDNRILVNDFSKKLFELTRAIKIKASTAYAQGEMMHVRFNLDQDADALVLFTIIKSRKEFKDATLEKLNGQYIVNFLDKKAIW